MEPINVVLVVTGVHEQYEVLAVARTDDEAQQWADAWNIFHQDEIRQPEDEARVGDWVPAVM